MVQQCQHSSEAQISQDSLRSSVSPSTAMSSSNSSQAPKSEYAQGQEMRHRRKIVLPCVIPWEYGSNKFASQRGTSGFGAIRNQVVKIESSKNLSNSDDSSVPWLNCPSLKEKYASQAGEKPFGGMRDHVTKVKESEGEDKKMINDIVVDKKATARILKKWDRPNPEAKNDQIYGKRRDATTNPTGGRRFTADELSKSRAAIPKFQCVNETSAAQNSKPGEAPTAGYRSHRQVTTMINGLDRTLQDQLDTNKYMAWVGGQVTLQSQSHTGGFHKPRDVVSTSYYDRLMTERNAELEAKKLHEKLQKELERRQLNGEENGDASNEDENN